MATLYYRPYTSELENDEPGPAPGPGAVGYPPHNAVQCVLPEYQYIFADPDPKHHHQQASDSWPSIPRLMPEDVDKSSIHLLDHQMRELEKYRSAVQKMGQDILTLRGEMRDLEANNSQLRRTLSKYDDTTKLMLDSQELDGLTKPELAARYVALKQKLTSQTAELRDYKDRVQQLHNDLIHANDQEKQFLKVNNAHKSQNQLLQKLQEKAQKVKRMEEACKKQEKVIEKMERLLSRKPREKPSQDDGRVDALTEENRRLRYEMEDLREQNRLLLQGKGIQASDDEERLHLFEKVDASAARIISLEKQLTENARQWGKEKSDLMNRLQEAELGLKRVDPFTQRKLPNPTSFSYDPAARDDTRRHKYTNPSKPHKLLYSARDDIYNY